MNWPSLLVYHLQIEPKQQLALLRSWWWVQLTWFHFNCAFKECLECCWCCIIVEVDCTEHVFVFIKLITCTCKACNHNWMATLDKKLRNPVCTHCFWNKNKCIWYWALDIVFKLRCDFTPWWKFLLDWVNIVIEDCSLLWEYNSSPFATPHCFGLLPVVAISCKRRQMPRLLQIRSITHKEWLLNLVGHFVQWEDLQEVCRVFRPLQHLWLERCVWFVDWSFQVFLLHSCYEVLLIDSFLLGLFYDRSMSMHMPLDQHLFRWRNKNCTWRSSWCCAFKMEYFEDESHTGC